MSDNLEHFCAIRNALSKLRAHEPRGNFARRLLTLVSLISGITGSILITNRATVWAMRLKSARTI